MAYTGEVLRRARERLAQAKAEREAENAEHLRRAYRQVPRLAEIDRALRLTMAQAAQTVFQQGATPRRSLPASARRTRPCSGSGSGSLRTTLKRGSWTMPPFAPSAVEAATWGPGCASASGSCAVRSRKRS